MSKILFSPLGKTDPISNQRDGSMLHICRVYQPDTIYLYMSKEVCDDQKKDERYTYCIKKLGERLGKTFHVEMIERPELAEVHKLDDFYQEFNKILQDISEQGNHEILLNVSSGTPAMKMTLQVLASLNQTKYKAIQVGTPMKSSNKSHEDTDDYEVELQWEFNLDNEEEFENRCQISETMNLFLNVQKENMKRLVREYDYAAALTIAKNMEESLTEKAMNYLKAAEKRNLLDLSGVQKLLGNEIKEWFPVMHGKEREIVEYLLNLNIKQKKKQYADYIRAITPVILDLFLMYAKNVYGLTEDMFCSQRYNKIWYLDLEKMRKNCPEILCILQMKYRTGLKENPLSSEYMSEIIIEKDKELVVKQDVMKIREIEKKIRNYAAHEIVAITEESIKKDAEIQPKEIVELLWKIAVRGGIKLKKEYWDSYDDMNQKIIEEIEKQP